MFELFIALFGGAYWTGKYINEKNKTKKAEQQYNNYINTYRRFKEVMVADLDTIQNTKKYILSGEHYDEICAEFKDDLKFVFGEDWKRKISLPTNSYMANQDMIRYPQYHSYWLYHLILATKGKVDIWVPGKGYGIAGIKYEKMCIRFAQCIEKRLRRTYPEITLGLELASGTDPNRPCSGEIKFESTTPYRIHRLW